MNRREKKERAQYRAYLVTIVLICVGVVALYWALTRAIDYQNNQNDPCSSGVTAECVYHSR